MPSVSVDWCWCSCSERPAQAAWHDCGHDSTHRPGIKTRGRRARVCGAGACSSRHGGARVLHPRTTSRPRGHAGGLIMEQSARAHKAGSTRFERGRHARLAAARQQRPNGHSRRLGLGRCHAPASCDSIGAARARAIEKAKHTNKQRTRRRMLRHLRRRARKQVLPAPPRLRATKRRSLSPSERGEERGKWTRLRCFSWAVQ